MVGQGAVEHRPLGPAPPVEPGAIRCRCHLHSEHVLLFGPPGLGKGVQPARLRLRPTRWADALAGRSLELRRAAPTTDPGEDCGPAKGAGRVAS